MAILDEFVPPESINLDEDLFVYSYPVTTIICGAGKTFEYLQRISVDEDPQDVLNAAFENICVTDTIYGTVLTSQNVIGGIGSITQLSVSGISTLNNVYVTGSVGIGSTGPSQKLDIAGSIKLDNLIYDIDNNAGQVGWFLTRDGASVRWTPVAPGFGGGIIVLEEGNAVTGSVGVQTYSIINFLSGSGASPYELVDIQVSAGNSSQADITIKDFWTKNGVGDIYRNSNVGINNASPSFSLDVNGTAHVTGSVDFDSTLNVDGSVTFTNSTSSTSKDTGALVITNGGVGIEENLNIGGKLSVTGITTLFGFVKVDDDMIVTGFITGTISTAIYAGYANTSGFSTFSGYSDFSGISTYSDFSGIATFANFAGVSTYSDFSGIATFANFAGVSTYSDFSGIATFAQRSGVTTFADFAGISTYSDFSGISTFAVRSGVTTFADIAGVSTFIRTVNTTNDQQYYIPFVQNFTSTNQETVRVDSGIKYNPDKNSLNLDGSLSVGTTSLFNGAIELNSALIDVNNSTAAGKVDYRLASVGTGVSWRPPGVQTQNAIWVTMDGNDSNSGYLEGDAKRTVGAAASIAEPGDTIFIRSGVYYENNPIGLRTDVSVSGQELRLVTIVPNNPNKDVFHVRRGCLIENLNFAGSSVLIDHTGCGAVAFPPTQSDVIAGIAYSSVTGYTEFGPATEGPSGRWRSPYVRNCTNFMTKSIGMKIDGNHATASTIGADLKSMVCDSFTQYNEAGIGVSITNNGYAQLVSIFTINCDIGIYAASGGSCDLTNSNSSFGNFGLVAVGLGSTEFTGKVNADTNPEVDTVVLKEVYDGIGTARRPYDGQALWFKINLDNYPDTVGTGTITAPLQELSSITVLNGGSGFSAASPPNVIIRDADGTVQPKGPQGIIAEVSPTINDAGQIVAIDVVSTGRNYLSTQNIVVDIEGNTGLATAVMAPIYYTVSVASSTTPSPSGVTTVTFNEFIPYELFDNDPIELKRISRILTSSHSFEYIGTGTDINTATPLKGAVPIKANEVVARDGAQIPFTSTDQKGNFDIGEGIQIDQTTSTIRGRDFSRAIQAEVTPLILALR